MRAVGVRELKNRLSEYLRHVRAGETVLVTDRGVVIAEVRPPGDVAVALDPHPGLTNLVRRGLITEIHENDPQAYPRLPRRGAEGTVKRLLDELRGE